MSRVNLKEESYKFYIIVASILSLSIIIFTTYFAKFGFDITDEGFYFNNILFHEKSCSIPKQQISFHQNYEEQDLGKSDFL